MSKMFVEFRYVLGHAKTHTHVLPIGVILLGFVPLGFVL